MAKFGLSLIDAKRCTPVDFEYYQKAYEIKTVEEHRLIAAQAWMNQTVQATTEGKNPKPKYKHFNDFYDYKKEFYSVFGKRAPEKKRLTLADKNRLLNQSLKKGG